MSAAWKRHGLCLLPCWSCGFSIMLWCASRSCDTTAASRGYSCLPNRADTQLQTLSVTRRDTKSKRDGEEEMKESKRKTDRPRERRKVAGTEKDEKERLVSTAGFSPAGTVYLRWCIYSFWLHNWMQQCFCCIVLQLLRSMWWKYSGMISMKLELEM